MAVLKTTNSRSLNLITVTTDANGKTKTTSKSLGNLKSDAATENIVSVANSIKAVLSRSIDEIRVVENSTLSEV